MVYHGINSLVIMYAKRLTHI